MQIRSLKHRNRKGFIYQSQFWPKKVYKYRGIFGIPVKKNICFFIGSNLKTYLVSQFVCVTCGSKSRLLKKMDPGANSLTHRRAETGRGCRSSSSVGGGFFSGRIKCLERQFNQLKSTSSTGKSDCII